MIDYKQLIESYPEFVGTKRYCNICGHRFSKFLLFNQRSPREAQCPVCGSLERHRHLFVHLASIFPLLEGKKVLHFAPEIIIKDFFMSSKAEYFDADIAEGRASYQEDITQISFNDETFDYIVCNHVLEHIPDDVKAMQEMYRVLKKGGIAYLSVPLRKGHLEDLSITDPKERLKIFGQEDHVRYYSLDMFLRRLNSVGFDLSVSESENLPPSLQDAMANGTIVLAKK